MKVVLFVLVSFFWFFNPAVAEILQVKKEKSLSLSGFVDASYTQNQLQGISTFSLDQVELDIVKEVDGRGAVRADINFLRKEDDPTTPTIDESKLSTDEIIEQGFVTINKGGFAIRIGKFNAPIGFESLDPVDMYQNSHAMVFDYGLPTNLTGAEIAGNYGTFGFSFYMVNGWDKISDDNSDKTIGTRLSMTPGDGSSIGVSYITGSEKGSGVWRSPEPLTVYDIDISYRPSENFIVGFEYSNGKHEKNSVLQPGIENAEWTGFLVMMHYDFSKMAGMTFRYDTFNDKDGVRFGTGVQEKRESWVAASTFSFGEGFAGLSEYRWTKSDKNVFLDKDGKGITNENTFSIELTYIF